MGSQTLPQHLPASQPLDGAALLRLETFRAQLQREVPRRVLPQQGAVRIRLHLPPPCWASVLNQRWGPQRQRASLCRPVLGSPQIRSCSFHGHKAGGFAHQHCAGTSASFCANCASSWATLSQKGKYNCSHRLCHSKLCQKGKINSDIQADP